MTKIALLALCAFLTLPLPASYASPLTAPEKLVYDVSWTGVTAATSVQEVSARGNEVRITSTTRSARWLNTFFAVDDHVESVISRDGNDQFGTPKSFRERLSEGKHRVQKECQFDVANLKVQTKDHIKKTEKTDPISARTFDTLASVYYIRSLDLVPGKSVYIDVYDCKRLWKTEVQVLGREEVKTPLGKFKTIVVHPVLKCDGFFARTGDVTVWLTDDAQRIPVKMTTKVKIGKITATLVGGSYWPTMPDRSTVAER